MRLEITKEAVPSYFSIEKTGPSKKKTTSITEGGGKRERCANPHTLTHVYTTHTHTQFCQEPWTCQRTTQKEINYSFPKQQTHMTGREFFGFLICADVPQTPSRSVVVVGPGKRGRKKVYAAIYRQVANNKKNGKTFPFFLTVRKGGSNLVRQRHITRKTKHTPRWWWRCVVPL